MTFKQADNELSRIGAAHAKGYSLAALLAGLATSLQGGKAETYYDWIVKQPDYYAAGKLLMRDRQAAWDVLLGIEPTPTQEAA